MTPNFDIGLSASSSQAASTGSGATNISNNSYGSNPYIWIVVGVVALLGFIAFLKLKVK